jgi:hypothetical protein
LQFVADGLLNNVDLRDGFIVAGRPQVLVGASDRSPGRMGIALYLYDPAGSAGLVNWGIIATDIHASGGEPDRAERLAPQVPMQRAGSADEVAAAIVWLLSAEASYVTGTTIDVAGGR